MEVRPTERGNGGPGGSGQVNACACANTHQRRRVVLTGGPGAGKTAVLELIRQSLCAHVKVLPEAAGVVFGGGFPREDDPGCLRAAQRAIYHVQRELEAAGEVHNAAVVLCDRGTVDGLAYVPEPREDFWPSLHTTLEDELGRNDTVIHLRTPTVDRGYNRSNPLRTESPAAAAAIDARILEAWADHPRRFIVDPSDAFLDKATRTLAIIRNELPDCCAQHADPPQAADFGPGGRHRTS